MAHPLQSAAGQPPGDLGLGAGVRPGADPPRWSPALPATQQPTGTLHQPERDQPEAADVPGMEATLRPRRPPEAPINHTDNFFV